MSWAVLMFVSHLLRSHSARVLVAGYVLLLVWWNLAVPITARGDAAVLASIQMQWPRWLVYAWLLLACATPRIRDERVNLMATGRSALNPSSVVDSDSRVGLTSWAQVRLLVEALTLFAIGLAVTATCVVLRGQGFHVEPCVAGGLLALAATLQVSVFVSVFGERTAVAWITAATLAFMEVWYGRSSHVGPLAMAAGFALAWAGISLVVRGLVVVLRQRVVNKVKV